MMNLHSHGVLGLLLSLSCLLLPQFFSHLGLFLNFIEALTAHLLGTQALLGSKLPKTDKTRLNHERYSEMIDNTSKGADRGRRPSVLPET